MRNEQGCCGSTGEGENQAELTHCKAPQPPDVLASLKACGLQTLIQAALGGHQPADPCPDDGHSVHHGVLLAARGAQRVTNKETRSAESAKTQHFSSHPHGLFLCFCIYFPLSRKEKGFRKKTATMPDGMGAWSSDSEVAQCCESAACITKLARRESQAGQGSGEEVQAQLCKLSYAETSVIREMKRMSLCKL